MASMLKYPSLNCLFLPSVLAYWSSAVKLYEIFAHPPPFVEAVDGLKKGVSAAEALETGAEPRSNMMITRTVKNWFKSGCRAEVDLACILFSFLSKQIVRGRILKSDDFQLAVYSKGKLLI